MSSLDDLFNTKPKKQTPPEVNREADLVDMVLDSEGQIIGLYYSSPEIYIEQPVNKKYLTKDGRFLIDILDNLVTKGVNDVTNVVLLTEVSSLGLKEQFEEIGGIKLIEDLKKITRVENAEAIIDNFSKWSLVKAYYKKGILDINKVKWEKLVAMKSSDVYDWIEYQLDSVDLDVSSDYKFEKLSYTKNDIQDLIDGVNMGLQYGTYSRLLNELTLGVQKSDMYLVGSYTGGGKSSFCFENIIIPIIENGHKVCIISNEQQAMAFKNLLCIHILTNKLNYYKLTRKKIRKGEFTDEDLKMMDKAMTIAEREYNPKLDFVKLYDYQIGKVGKIARKVAKTGTELIFYDTLKCDDNGDKAVWERLLKDSKDLFQIASKNNLAILLSVQLALATKGHVRFLDHGVLSNGKQISEVMDTAVYFRDLWDDEYTGETYDVKPYKWRKNDITGKYEKEYITLDKEKKYKIFFLAKTRSDETGVALIYEVQGDFNKFKEIGRCHPSTKNVY